MPEGNRWTNCDALLAFAFSGVLFVLLLAVFGGPLCRLFSLFGGPLCRFFALDFVSLVGFLALSFVAFRPLLISFHVRPQYSSDWSCSLKVYAYKPVGRPIMQRVAPRNSGDVARMT